MMVYTCNPSYLRDWGWRITWVQEFKAVVSSDCATKVQPGLGLCLSSQHFGRSRRADHLRSGVWDQPGQYAETLFLWKYKNYLDVVAGACNPNVWEAEVGENHLNLGGGAFGKPRSRHCTPSWWQSQTLFQINKRTRNVSADMEGRQPWEGESTLGDVATSQGASPGCQHLDLRLHPPELQESPHLQLKAPPLWYCVMATWRLYAASLASSQHPSPCLKVFNGTSN